MTPSLSVVIPVHNRAALLAFPLESLRAAWAMTPGLDGEIIVVDDGSTENVEAVTRAFSDLPIRLHRQDNRGLLAARLLGLSLAQKDAILFLDGDDLVSPEKFRMQLPPLRDADVSYGDVGRVVLPTGGTPLPVVRPDAALPVCSDPAEFYLRLQPTPHNPVFRRDYLNRALESPPVPASRTYDPIAETWYYYLLSVHPARIAHIPGLWSIVGEHSGERVSRAWERQAWAALQLMQAFTTAYPQVAMSGNVRRHLGRCAFATWRALPHHFEGFPVDAFLAIWRAAPGIPLSELGGPFFGRLARWIGPVAAGRFLRRFQCPHYQRIRTLDAAQLAALCHG